MSTYCISDLHGRYDLFLGILEKINFDYDNDKLYILGDIIDVNSGATDIFKHIFAHPKSFEVILGNHEYNLVNEFQWYDTFMLNDDLRKKIKDLSDVFSSKYSDVKEEVKIILENGNFKNILNSKSIKKWLLDVNKKPNNRRKRILDAVLDLFCFLNEDVNKFNNIIHKMTFKYGQYDSFKSKNFFKELLTLEANEYQMLKEYILSKDRKTSRNDYIYFDNITLNINNKTIILAHQISNHRPIDTRFYDLGIPFKDPGVTLPHTSKKNDENLYFIFGHKPVAAIHREFNGEFYSGYNFNYKEVFSYIDRKNNHYYNIDMTDNLVAAICLDNFEEFYYMRYKRKKKIKHKPPEEATSVRKTGYRRMKIDFPGSFFINGKKAKRTVSDEYKFVSYNDYCMEYLICVSKRMKEIYYKRVNYLPYVKFEVISNIKCDFDNFDEVIKIVREYDDLQKTSKEIIDHEEFLRNLFL